jgi:hypothetical protein
MSPQVGACNCSDCRAACTNTPGWFTPDQIEPLAQALGLTVDELFADHLRIDWWEGESPVFVLAPKLRGREGGEMADGDPHGTCHWYVDEKCAIHETGHKPAECARLGHVDGERVHFARKELIAAWRPKKMQAWIRELYGGEPEAEEYHGGIFGGLGLW